MKKREGYISIIALIVMTISITIVLRMNFLNSQQSQIVNSRANAIQSYYISEGKILMSLYGDEYYNDQLYPTLIDVFRKNNFSAESKKVIIHKSDLEDCDNSNEVKLAFQDIDNRKELILKSKSDYKGMQTKTKARVTLVNELFEIKESVLALETLEDEYRDNFEKLLKNIEEDISVKNIHPFNSLYTKEIQDYTKIYLKTNSDNIFKLYCTRDTMEFPYVEGFDKREVFLVVKSTEDNKATFYLDCSERPMHIKGLIYIDGDLEITGDFTFSGIIIVNNGKIKINGDTKPKVNGMMILYEDENIIEVNERMDVKYFDFTVYKYGTLIPGFFEINLKSIKNGE